MSSEGGGVSSLWCFGLLHWISAFLDVLRSAGNRPAGVKIRFVFPVVFLETGLLSLSASVREGMM